MSESDPRPAEGVPVKSEHAAASDESRRAGEAEGNHVPPKAAADAAPSPQTTNNPPDDRSGLDRAEEVVDYVAEKISSWASVWGRKLLRLSSRTRESAQDFWADVQDFRQGKKP